MPACPILSGESVLRQFIHSSHNHSFVRQLWAKEISEGSSKSRPFYEESPFFESLDAALKEVKSQEQGELGSFVRQAFFFPRF